MAKVTLRAQSMPCNVYRLVAIASIQNQSHGSIQSQQKLRHRTGPPYETVRVLKCKMGSSSALLFIIVDAVETLQGLQICSWTQEVLSQKGLLRSPSHLLKLA